MTNNKKITLLIIVGFFSIAYIVPTVLFAYDAPNAYDDLLGYILQFDRLFLGQPSFLERIKFFIEPTNFPHPQISVRVCSYISYLILGEIDFYYINLFGALLLPIFFFLLIIWDKITSIPFAILLASVLLVPVATTGFWKVAIVGGGFSTLCAYCSFYFQEKKNLGLTLLFMFLTVFSGGTGFMVVPISIIFFYEYFKYDKVFSLKCICGSVVILLLFYYVVTSGTHLQQNNFSGLEEQKTSLFSIGLFKLVAFLTTCGQAINSYLRINNTPYQVLIGFFVLVTVLFSIIYCRKKISKVKTELGFWLFWVIPIAIAALLRFKFSSWENIWNVIIPRYESFSVYFLSGTLLLLYGLFKDHPIFSNKNSKSFVLMSIIALFLYVPRYITNFDRLRNSENYSNSYMLKHLLGYSQIGHYHKYLNLDLPSSISSSLFIPNSSWYAEESEITVSLNSDATLSDTTSLLAPFNLRKLEVEKDILIIHLEVALMENNFDEFYLYLKSDKINIDIPFETNFPNQFLSSEFAFRNKKLFLASLMISCNLNTDTFPLGVYEMFLKRNQNNKPEIKLIPYKIELNRKI